MEGHHFELDAENSDNAITITVGGRVDGANAEDLHARLDEMVNAQDTKPILLDLHKLTYISSAGLRTVLRVAQAMKGKGLYFALVGLPPHIKEVVQLTGFDKIIDVQDNLSSAIQNITR